MKRSVCAIGHFCRSSSQIGYGFSTQRGSRWSKSVAQSVTGGRRLMGGASQRRVRGRRTAGAAAEYDGAKPGEHAEPAQHVGPEPVLQASRGRDQREGDRDLTHVEGGQRRADQIRGAVRVEIVREERVGGEIRAVVAAEEE